MICNKYGKVIIIALINVIAVCFVYNNVATEDIEHEHMGGDTLDKGLLQHSIKTTISDNKQKVNVKQSIGPANSQRDTGDMLKKANIDTQTSDTKISDTENSDTQTAVRSINHDSQKSSKHDAVMSMKNLLSIKIKAVRATKTIPVSSIPLQDGELNGRLLDSSEIDLSPPNPIIKYTSEAITDQVKMTGDLFFICFKQSKLSRKHLK